MFLVRPYEADDYLMIASWWREHQEIGPTEAMLPVESTFIVEQNKMPVLCATLYLTNTKEFCIVDNLVANPNVKEKRKHAVEVMDEHLVMVAKKLGYKKLLCMTEKPVLKKRYMEFGFMPTLENLTALIKEIR